MTLRFLPLVAVLLVALPGRAQDDLRLQGLVPVGLRTSLTESWGTLEFGVANPTDTARDARVVVLFPDQQAIRYGRDVWVPARATLTTWLPIGPAPAQASNIGRDIEAVLSDRTGGTDRPIFLQGEKKVRDRPVMYKPRAPTTAILVDYLPPDGSPESAGRLAPRTTEAVALARIARAGGGMSPDLAILPDGPLPPVPEAFDGTDHLILAGNRLAADPAGRQAIRHWVAQGGRLWVLLDLVDAETIAPILGDDLPFQVVDRVGLTTLKWHRPGEAPPAGGREFEQPVDQVRVLLGPADQVMHMANGWPATFVRPVGRGRIVVTTLAAAAWHQPAPAGKSKLLVEARPATAVATSQLEDLVAELQPRDKPHPFTPEDLRPLLTEEIGYTVPGRGVAAGVLGAFLAALVLLGIGLRRSRRPELVGWLAPAAALAAGAVFLVMGQASRRAVPATIAVAAVADVVPGTGEAAVNGLFAVYQPESGLVPLATRHGGLVNLDPEGLEGQVRLRVQTDTGAWHMEDLALPAGVRTGPVQYTARTGPVSAVVRFGPDGVEGTLTAAGFRELADALITTPAREPVAVRLGPDGSFRAGPADQLAAGQFLAGAVLTDQQQRRQAVYRQLLTSPLPRHLEGRDLLMAWAEPDGLPFSGREGSRVIGTVLLTVPLTYERPAPGTRVTIPPAFVPYRRIAEGIMRAPTLESPYPVEMDLRFQLPAAVRPLTVERATVHLRIRAPSRRVAVAGLADGQAVPLYSEESPAEPARIEIADAPLLRVDDQGGLLLRLSVTNIGGGQLDNSWKIESLGLEVLGVTADR